MPDTGNAPRRRVAVLGSTGSIGTQALDVIRGHRSVGNAPCWGLDFDERLKPQQTTRSIAHDVDLWQRGDTRSNPIRTNCARR